MMDTATATTTTTTTTLTRRIILGILLGGLFIVSYTVLNLFLMPMASAGIIVFVTWPFYVRLRHALGGRATVSALVMTLLLMVAFILPLIWLTMQFQDEFANTYAILADYLAQKQHPIPDVIARIPWLGNRVQSLLNEFAASPDAVRSHIATWVELRTNDLLSFLGGIGRNAAKLGFTLFSLFFIYRDGECFLKQVQSVLHRFLGTRIDGYLEAAASTTKAVVYGLVLTALAQGILAAIGYWFAGLEAPILLAALTAAISFIPFGTPIIWAPVGIWLLLKGQAVAGIGLLLWGALVVSWVDNVIRPLIIGAATHIPFLFITFGVIGGLAAFGFAGLFLGPVILAILMAVWREWIEDTQSPSKDVIPIP